MLPERAVFNQLFWRMLPPLVFSMGAFYDTLLLLYHLLSAHSPLIFMAGNRERIKLLTLANMLLLNAWL